MITIKSFNLRLRDHNGMVFDFNVEQQENGMYIGAIRDQEQSRVYATTTSNKMINVWLWFLYMLPPAQRWFWPVRLYA